MIQIPHAQIRAAINSVVETFATTPVVYHRLKGASMDRFKEGGNKTVEDITFLGLVEYGSEKLQIDLQGAGNWQGVKITFKAEDWEAANLYINGEVKANTATDYLSVNGKRYKIDNIMPDGPFQTRNLLIVVVASLQPVEI